jgi:cation diffusion facilitator CzcD-associated flavoprotein CzcO
VPAKIEPKICVIGAGPSGLTTLKNLSAQGLTQITCFEAGTEVGGLWVINDAHGHSSIYPSTHIISSKSRSQFHDFPMPADFPDFPSCQQMKAYFQAYAETFGVKRFIRFRTRVDHAARGQDGRWHIAFTGPAGMAEDTFDHLFVCSGHHSAPRMPEYPGKFSGETLHAHSYKTPGPFKHKRVLVVGGGNSACDIAVDLSRVAKATAISMREGYYIVPKLVFGAPVDVMYRKARWMPKPLRQWVLTKALKLLVGPWERYGLQTPSRPIMSMHPTLNSDILNLLRHGRVQPRVGIERLDGHEVVFLDGKRETYDTIIWATGYRTRFPFFERSFIDWEDKLALPLYLKMMLADVPNVFFIGLFQPIGCLWTLADLQAEIAARQIIGDLARPTDIAARVEHEKSHPHWRFEPDLRHAFEVDYYDLEKSLLRELKHTNPSPRQAMRAPAAAAMRLGQ